MILLLDEPGLNLHAEAQKDLLRYIDEKLTPKYQVIYTTHSPFMIDSTKLHEIRTAYDSNETKVGTSISNAIEEKDKGTLFPLQAALGYNLAQNLYISENNLLVEGVADLVILTIMSDLLRNMGKESLNEKFTIVPVGGLDKVATFISLLRGNNLNIVCVLDTFIDQKGQTRIKDLVFDKIIKESNVLFFHEFTGPIKPAELEDMFEKREYLEWFNSEYKKDYEQIDIKKLSTDRSIIPQINKIIHQDRFNHYRIARYLSQNISTIHDWEKSTISRFEKLFITVNKLIK
jgi:predicted ATP-dependent endonuclease of OLD family